MLIKPGRPRPWARGFARPVLRPGWSGFDLAELPGLPGLPGGLLCLRWSLLSEAKNASLLHVPVTLRCSVILVLVVLPKSTDWSPFPAVPTCSLVAPQLHVLLAPPLLFPTAEACYLRHVP